MDRYRKKPVVVEAMGPLNTENASEIASWSGALEVTNLDWDYDVGAYIKRPGRFSGISEGGKQPPGSLIIETLEGDHLALPGDYIIQGIEGEFYPCKPGIFKATYEPVGN